MKQKPTDTPLIDLKNLTLRIGNATILNNISFKIGTQEIVSLVGESGSGKSITALSLLGLQPDKSIIKANRMVFNGINIRELTSKNWQKIRGKSIGMVFQEPQSSLNPSMRCGKQLQEVLQKHTSLSKNEQKQTIREMLAEVQLTDTKRILTSYPHQLSGGQKQRIMIAMALLCKPKLLIADEPTTALDVTVQKEIIQLLKNLQQKYKMSILFISHDLALVKQLADRVFVMYQGQIVEEGETKSLFKIPQHPYTKGLLFARPKTEIRLKRLPTLADYQSGEFQPTIISSEERQKVHLKLYKKTPILEVKGLEKIYKKRSWRGVNQEFKAVRSLDFSIYPGETLGLVGESGCGKSTLAKALIYLDPPSKGSIKFEGKPIVKSSRALRKLRKEVQFIFQDPYAALHPLKTIGNAISEVLHVHQITTTPQEQLKRCQELLNQVGLSDAYSKRYPHELSGGQRQRAVIARALATEPKLLICDESVAALDISVQAQVLNLLNDLKKELGLSYLFISHDLAVVKYMSDRVMVMEHGQLQELQEADKLYAKPQHTYTKKLIDAIPVLNLK
ncbi:ABC transporter ATP-binding protein [Flavobacteriaceae bacterium]|nr:ABC transporter ATP-binding protein [Flavobacteriaceae bacterium]